MYNKESKIYKCSHCKKMIVGDNGIVVWNKFDKLGCPVQPKFVHKDMDGAYICGGSKTDYSYEIKDFFEDFSYNITRQVLENN